MRMCRDIRTLVAAVTGDGRSGEFLQSEDGLWALSLILYGAPSSRARRRKLQPTWRAAVGLAPLAHP